MKNLLKMATALAAVALLAGVVGTGGTAHADDPAFDFGQDHNFDLSGLTEVGKLQPPPAQPPASAVEAPSAATSTGTDTGAGAPAPETVPSTGAAQRAQLLPNTGTGGTPGGGAPVLALMLAIAGAVCVGAAAFRSRAEGVRARAR